MDMGQTILESIELRQQTIKKYTAPGDSTIQKFYAGRKIFVTGGSGFIGKLFLEKLCRTCEIDKIYMLIRPKKNKNSQERLCDILKDTAFESLHKERPQFEMKIIPVEGDMTEKRLGLSDNDWNTIVTEVDMIFHIAANVRFDVELKEAVLSNVRGTREILALAKACPGLRAHVHVSTAYTFATNDRIGGLVLEEFQPSIANPDAIIQLAETMSPEKLNELTSVLLKGWPNTYTFTKAIAEEAVRTSSDDLPICVVRPAIVIPTIVEPAPGWVDISNVFGPSGIVLGLGMGIIRVLFSKRAVRIGFIPADLVTNAIIAAGWETATKKPETEKKIDIYTVSNIRNPITWGDCGTIMRKYRNKLATPKAIWHCGSLETSNASLYLLYSILFHFIPAYIIDGFCFLVGKKRRFVKLYEKVYKLNTVLGYFTCHDWQFSDENVHRLFKRMSKTDQIIFNFDVSPINWTEVITVWWIGLRRYILKDGLKDTEYGNKKQFVLSIMNYILFIAYMYLIVKISLYVFMGTSFLISSLF